MPSTKNHSIYYASLYNNLLEYYHVPARRHDDVVTLYKIDPVPTRPIARGGCIFFSLLFRMKIERKNVPL